MQAKSGKSTKKGQKKSKSIVVRKAPAAKATNFRNRSPKFSVVDSETIRIHHCEYVGDVMSDTNNEFAYDVFALDPSDPSTFPWLSVIAARYESFNFDALRVHYRGAVGTNTSGKALIAIDYDSKDDTDLNTKAAFLQWAKSTDCAVWDNIVHVSEKADLQRVGPWRFTNNTSSTDDPNDRLTSAGNLFVGTTSVNGLSTLASGPPATYVAMTLGELFIEYDVRLKTPVLHVNDGNDVGFISETTSSSVGFGTDALASFADATVAAIGAVVGKAGSNSQVTNIPPSNLPLANKWVSAAGSVVDPSQTLIKFAKDFKGVVDFVATVTSSPLTIATSYSSTVVPLIANATATGNTTNPTSRQQFPVIDTLVDTNSPAGTYGVGTAVKVLKLLVNAASGTSLAINIGSLGSGFPVNVLRYLSVSKQPWKSDLLTKRMIIDSSNLANRQTSTQALMDQFSHGN